ncbi:DNA/RNA nuclease SfsA [Halomonas sp. Bachu 37]|uniref:DNA/RNA nuclease SfsA n=1 Tax=Halomonas kashgarensis TaxID=3084920 RepID=UPI0032174CB6
MVAYPPLVPGVLLRRYKRFLADIRLDDGREVLAHCPNTGSMRAVNVPGSRVWLSASDNPKRKLAWTWELIELAQDDGTTALASVHTGRTNRIVEAALQSGVVTPLKGYSELRREVKVNDARLDFKLADAERGEAYVEVKQVTLKEPDGHGYFPDAVSVRGTKHLASLAELAKAGRRAVLLFCVAHEGIDDVAAAEHIDPVYARALHEAARAGVELLAYRVSFTRQQGRPEGVALAAPVPIRWA